MLKGCKHYFTMFGMLASAINIALHRLFALIETLRHSDIAVIVRDNRTQLQHRIEKNQIYQG